MTRLPDLGELRPSEKDDLIRSLWALLQEQQSTIEDQAKRIRELEAKLNAPPKDPTNSSLPPSSGQKSNKPKGEKKRRRRPGLKRSGGGRALHPNPDRRHVAKAGQCAHCDGQTPDFRFYQLYDKVYREDILLHTCYRARTNRDAPGVDRQSFAPRRTDRMRRDGRWTRSRRSISCFATAIPM